MKHTYLALLILLAGCWCYESATRSTPQLGTNISCAWGAVAEVTPTDDPDEFIVQCSCPEE